MYHLKEDEVPEVNGILRSIPIARRDARIAGALTLFNQAYRGWRVAELGTLLPKRPLLADFWGESERLVSFWVVLEALFASKDDDQIGGPVAKRVAAYTGIQEGKLKDLWKLRCDMVHGRRFAVEVAGELAKRHKQNVLAAGANEVENIARDSLKRAVTDPPSLTKIRTGISNRTRR